MDTGRERYENSTLPGSMGHHISDDPSHCVLLPRSTLPPMSMSTHVVGFRPADEKWEQMKTIWLACTKAGIGAPEEVLDFFKHEDPIGKPGIEISIDNALKEWASTIPTDDESF